MADTDIYNLEFLSLVAKITQEVDNYTGISDKTLAEFVISLHDDSKTLPGFKQKLKDIGANFPESFVENVNRLILNMHPKHKKRLAIDGKKIASAEPGGLDDMEKRKRMFPGLALTDQELQASVTKDVLMKEVEVMMSQFEGVAKKTRPRPTKDERSPKRQRSSRPHSHTSPLPHEIAVVVLQEEECAIYNGRITGLKEFGAFVQLEGIAGRAEGMVHVSNIQQGARANSAAHLLRCGQSVKVKVMSVAENRIGLSMKDVDQATGRDLTPHLRIKSETELAEEDQRQAAHGTNVIPLNSGLISSGAIDASGYPDLEEDFSNLIARAEVEEELDVEIREEEPAFLVGQTKKTLELNPVKIIKAPDGSLNRAALAGASLAKERRELRQQEANEQADSEARDYSSPWLDPMSKDSDRIFAQDLRGNLRGQKAGEQPKWKEATFNKATTFGEITSLSIQDQRKNLPIYKLRDSLLQAIREHQVLIVVGDTGSGKTTQMTQYMAEDGLADRGR
ncbi:Pre-mRNA-splicing factor ATP-dependent RNA helicase prp22 [Grifola frondosa]|uniref:Pre-mRNA-splicing factor ATP-dependent RNA helicase prp22 n=1 Tax=Grifola frondosa TaxID=5627 RepID=A0A1C7MRQ9_GRIFR|nr:Pre-mRNA-splicing factor ATP-dependent RNA helicase prp22 [Grifola frondosa]